VVEFHHYHGDLSYRKIFFLVTRKKISIKKEEDFLLTDVDLLETRMTVSRNLSAKSPDIGGVKSIKYILFQLK